MKKLPRERKCIRALTAVTWLLALAVGLTWLASMGILTVVTAQEVYDRLYEYSRNMVDQVESVARLERYMYDETYDTIREDYTERQMLQAIALQTNSNLYSGAGKLIRSVEYPLEAAILFYDGAGRLLHNSGDDFIYFFYETQAEWLDPEFSGNMAHCGYIDIREGKDASWQDDPYIRFRVQYAGTRDLQGVEALRVTGYFEGNELKPVVMHYVTGDQVWSVVEEDEQFYVGAGTYMYEIRRVDGTGRLEWQLQFDHSADCDRGDLVTVYCYQLGMWEYAGKPLDYRGEHHESLAALAESLIVPAGAQLGYHDALRGMEQYSLRELLVFSNRTYVDDQARDWSTGALPPPDLILVTAVRCYPLACAIAALRNIYIISGLLALVLFCAVRGSVKKHLTAPLEEVSEAIASGRTVFPEWRRQERPPVWREPYALKNYYMESQDSLRMDKNERTRLQTALDYAKTAEETRRQMTSNIAHELKTPLAVVHSYAEGLKERIAEEKRDRYLDVILSETERMDGMVLEMLELSRLEAGKVKLARDQVSLGALARGVFDKLELAVQAKGLRLEYALPEDFTVSADESRIGQVIENFASNAVKYTPAGGQIRVKLQKSRSGVTFSIENESEPLSEAALAKVWDSFYRTDEARSGGGTGLGLAIAKSVVELHGGKCFAHNTKHGVEFGFTM